MSADDLTRLLDELGKRLGPTGQHVFELAVRQVYIDATIGLVTSLVALVALLVAFGWGVRFTRTRWAAAVAKYGNGTGYRSEPDSLDYIFPWFIAGVIGMFVLVYVVYALTSSLSALLNPEYAALRDILSAIGGTK